MFETTEAKDSNFSTYSISVDTAREIRSISMYLSNSDGSIYGLRMQDKDGNNMVDKQFGTPESAAWIEVSVEDGKRLIGLTCNTRFSYFYIACDLLIE